MGKKQLCAKGYPNLIGFEITEKHANKQTDIFAFISRDVRGITLVNSAKKQFRYPFTIHCVINVRTEMWINSNEK